MADIRAAFAAGRRRICYQAPPGAGKRIMMVYMATEAAKRNNATYFLLHRQELVDQTAETLEEYHADFGLITAGARIKDRAIQVASVQTLSRRIDKIPAPALIIPDECHHAVATTWRHVFDAWPDAYLVGLTATPQRLGGQGLGDVFDELIIGPTARELIQQGHLAPYRYYAPPQVADLAGVKIKMGDYDGVEIAARMDKPQIIGDAITHYARLAAGKRAIVYCASIAHSKNTAAAFNAVGVHAQHIDGETVPGVRRQAIENFKTGRLQIITNVDLIGEGLDVPGMEAVILLRPTASLTLFVQQSMRPMRPDKANPFKTAIILDHVGNALTHGLPDDDREWSLDGIKRRARGAAGVSIRQCPRCYSVHAPADKCPYCGFEYQPEPREVKQKAGELVELTAVEKKARRMQVGMCRTIEDVVAVAVNRGYAKGWVKFTCESKHIPFDWSTLNREWNGWRD